MVSVPMVWNDCPLHLQFLFKLTQAVFVLLLNRCQVTKASNITASSNFVVLPSWTTRTFTSLHITQTTNIAKIGNSSSIINQSVPSIAKSTSVFSIFPTSLSTKTRALPETTISVTQFSDAVTPTTAIIVTGLPDEKIVFVIAGILGAILVILFGTILWNLCIPLYILRRRPSSRVGPSDVIRNVSELVWVCREGTQSEWSGKNFLIRKRVLKIILQSFMSGSTKAGKWTTYVKWEARLGKGVRQSERTTQSELLDRLKGAVVQKLVLKTLKSCFYMGCSR